MKKFFLFAAAIVAMSLGFAACGGNEPDENNNGQDTTTATLTMFDEPYLGIGESLSKAEKNMTDMGFGDGQRQTSATGDTITTYYNGTKKAAMYVLFAVNNKLVQPQALIPAGEVAQNALLRELGNYYTLNTQAQRQGYQYYNVKNSDIMVGITQTAISNTTFWVVFYFNPETQQQAPKYIKAL